MDAGRWDNICRACAAYDAGSSTLTAGPQELFLEIATRCNLRCTMCPMSYADRRGQPPVFLPDLFARLRPIFPTLLRAHLFGLGEPLLNPHLLDYLRELSAAGVETRFTTNATLIDEATADRIARAGADRVAVSIDGARPESYERIRRGGRYEDARRGLEALAAARNRHGRPHVSVSCVAMASNLDDLSGLVELCAELGIPELNLEPLYYWGSEIPELAAHYDRESLAAAAADRVGFSLAAARRLAAERGVDLISRIQTDTPLDYRATARLRPPDRRWPCTEPWSTVSVTAAGEVQACCLNSVPLGHLYERSFDEIWNGSRYATFRAGHVVGGVVPAGCETCVANCRQRHSDMFVTVDAITQRPLLGDSPDLPRGYAPVIEHPAEGTVVTDPLVITGRLPWWGLGRRWTAATSELRVDHTSLLALANGIVAGSHFVLIIPTPFLTEGAHVLSIGERLSRKAGASPRSSSIGRSHRTVRFHRPPQSDGIAMARTAAVGVEIRQRTPHATISIDGRAWPAARWLSTRNGGRWVGAAVLDLHGLSPGGHILTVEPVGEPPVTRRITRIGAD